MEYLTQTLRETITHDMDDPKTIEQYISEFKLGNIKTKGRTLVINTKEPTEENPVASEVDAGSQF